MTSQEFLYYSLAVGWLILVGYISYAAYHLAQSLKSLRMILENTEDLTREVSLLKNGLKLGLLKFLNMFFKKRR